MYGLYQRLAANLEKFFKVDFRYVAHGGFFLTLTQVVSAIVGLLLTVAFSNLLPVETYGTYKYIIALYSLLAIGALPGIDTSLLQSVSRGHDAMFSVSIRARLRWGLIGTFAGILYGAYLFQKGSNILGTLVVIAGAAVPLMESFALYASFLNAKRRFMEWSLLDIVSQIFSALCLITVMIITKNIIALVLAYFVPITVARMFAAWYTGKNYSTESSHDHEFIGYARSMSIFQIIGRIMSSVDQIVLYHFLGPAQVAIFSLAVAIPNRMQSVFRITGTLALPKYANRNSYDVARSLPWKMALFAGGVITLCLLYIAVAPLLFTYIFPKYLPSIIYSQVVVFYTLAAITYPFGAYLMAHKKIRDNYIIAIGGFTTKLIILVTCVPFFGIWAAVAGILATSLMTICISLYMIWRERSIDANTDSVPIGQ